MRRGPLFDPAVPGFDELDRAAAVLLVGADVLGTDGGRKSSNGMKNFTLPSSVTRSSSKKKFT